MAFHEECIFCKIAAGKLPCDKVYENDDFIAFLDKYPRSTGHCQIVPKAHYRWVWDVPNLGDFMEAARKVVNAQRKAFGTEMIVCQIIGDEVPHAHIWLMPHDHSKNADVQGEAVAELIRKNLG